MPKPSPRTKMKHRKFWVLIDRESGEAFYGSVFKPKRDGMWWRDPETSRVLASYSCVKLAPVIIRELAPKSRKR